VLVEVTEELEELTLVAFGKQKKSSVVSAVTTVKVDELRVPSSNLTASFAGRIAGMISYQTSGEPGADNASFFIRGITTFGSGKVDPLILVDNMEISVDDLAKMHPDDISSFSVLKDATAAALYGARGANGVVLITTKEGKEGKAKLSVRIENSFSGATEKIKMVDPLTYMEMANEAASTRSIVPTTAYSRSKIEETRLGVNPYVYPAVDWMDMLIKNVTTNQRGNLNISGGGKVARYYVAGTFANDNGILKTDKRNSFDNNISYQKYTLRSNININVTESTELIVRLSGGFDDKQGPMYGGSSMYQKILKVSPVRFPAYYEPDEYFAKANHILFGNEGGMAEYLNPYAELMRGYMTETSSNLVAQLELKQDFGKWLPGLTGRLLGNTTRNASFYSRRSYNPYYYSVLNYNRLTDTYRLLEINGSNDSEAVKGTEYLDYIPGANSVQSLMYGEASLAYAQTFGKHEVGGMLVGVIRNELNSNALEEVPPGSGVYQYTLRASLPHRNLGLSGRFTYGYDDRYFLEANFGYNGSEKFAKNHRWGFFPSIGAGWMVSNEKFWEPLKPAISKLKFRYTYGSVGNDNIGSQRFFYLSNVAINEGRLGGAGSNFVAGYQYNGFGTGLSGVRITAYANPNIGWEVAYKGNFGVELGLFNNKLEIQADYWHEHRTNILQPRADIPVDMGLWETPQVNVGEAKGRGLDIQVDYNHQITKDLWITGRGNFTYAHSEYLYYEEPNFATQGLPWRSKVGRTTTQEEGYIAERLFIDEGEIANSPRQEVGTDTRYMAGDIKYKDLNGDGVVNSSDMAAIGYPKTPEINYGFGFTIGYKNLDFSVFFQGSGRSSFFIDPGAMMPFKRGSDAETGKITETGMAQFIADDHWTELEQNPYAAWPRLSFGSDQYENNTVKSTYWMRTSQFLRFKSFEVGYTLPKKLCDKLLLTGARFYLSGNNLLLFSKFKTWDVEMGSSGLNYPLQRVFNIGVNFSF
jgi:TonB-linked SusC/RagA family outer membrane protein